MTTHYEMPPGHRGTEELTGTEQALWRDPERLALIEAVLDDPSLAVPLEELE